MNSPPDLPIVHLGCKVPDPETLSALQELGVDFPADFHAITALPLPQAKVCLEELKKRVRAQLRRLALELHPDRNGGDPDKTRRFVVLSKVCTDIQNIDVHPLPPRAIGWINPLSSMNVHRTPSVVNPFRVKVIRFW